MWELESGRLFSLDAGDGLGIESMRALPGGRLLVRHVMDDEANPGLTLWDVEAAQYERIFVDDQVKF